MDVWAALRKAEQMKAWSIGEAVEVMRAPYRMAGIGAADKDGGDKDVGFVEEVGSGE